VTSGGIESSNVNSVEALVTMISLARLFEVQVKAMQEAEVTDEATTQLLRLR
jgi:flagellar basal-body rod protein FlgF